MYECEMFVGVMEWSFSVAFFGGPAYPDQDSDKDCFGVVVASLRYQTEASRTVYSMHRNQSLLPFGRTTCTLPYPILAF